MSDEGSNRKTRYGMYRAVVTDSSDPEERGRVRVRLESGQEAWAELATLLAGDGYGTWFRPDPEDEVLVAFEGGDPAVPTSSELSGGMEIGRRRWTTPPGQDDAHALRRDDHDRRRACAIHVEAPAESGSSPRLGSKPRPARRSSTRASFRVNAATANFTGVVRCDTLIANSVVASSYTPGAGNLI